MAVVPGAWDMAHLCANGHGQRLPGLDAALLLRLQCALTGGDYTWGVAPGFIQVALTARRSHGDNMRIMAIAPSLPPLPFGDILSVRAACEGASTMQKSKNIRFFFALSSACSLYGHGRAGRLRLGNKNKWDSEDLVIN